jgi:hypothetical protein
MKFNTRAIPVVNHRATFGGAQRSLGYVRRRGYTFKFISTLLSASKSLTFGVIIKRDSPVPIFMLGW